MSEQDNNIAKKIMPELCLPKTLKKVQECLADGRVLPESWHDELKKEAKKEYKKNYREPKKPPKKPKKLKLNDPPKKVDKKTDNEGEQDNSEIPEPNLEALKEALGKLKTDPKPENLRPRLEKFIASVRKFELGNKNTDTDETIPEFYKEAFELWFESFNNCFKQIKTDLGSHKVKPKKTDPKSAEVRSEENDNESAEVKSEKTNPKSNKGKPEDFEARFKALLIDLRRFENHLKGNGLKNYEVKACEFHDDYEPREKILKYQDKVPEFYNRKNEEFYRDEKKEADIEKEFKKTRVVLYELITLRACLYEVESTWEKIKGPIKRRDELKEIILRNNKKKHGFLYNILPNIKLIWNQLYNRTQLGKEQSVKKLKSELANQELEVYVSIKRKISPAKFLKLEKKMPKKGIPYSKNAIKCYKQFCRSDVEWFSFWALEETTEKEKALIKKEKELIAKEKELKKKEEELEEREKKIIAKERKLTGEVPSSGSVIAISTTSDNTSIENDEDHKVSDKNNWIKILWSRVMAGIRKDGKEKVQEKRKTPKHVTESVHAEAHILDNTHSKNGVTALLSRVISSRRVKKEKVQREQETTTSPRKKSSVLTAKTENSEGSGQTESGIKDVDLEGVNSKSKNKSTSIISTLLASSRRRKKEREKEKEKEKEYKRAEGEIDVDEYSEEETNTKNDHGPQLKIYFRNRDRTPNANASGTKPNRESNNINKKPTPVTNSLPVESNETKGIENYLSEEGEADLDQGFEQINATKEKEYALDLKMHNSFEEENNIENDYNTENDDNYATTIYIIDRVSWQLEQYKPDSNQNRKKTNKKEPKSILRKNGGESNYDSSSEQNKRRRKRAEERKRREKMEIEKVRIRGKKRTGQKRRIRKKSQEEALSTHTETASRSITGGGV